jgi:hypothetical protein
MSLTKFRWSQVYESSEEELVDYLHARRIENIRIHQEADKERNEQTTETATTIWCAEGSLIVAIGAVKTSLQPGDAFRIEPSTTYVIHPGIADCTYYLST